MEDNNLLTEIQRDYKTAQKPKRKSKKTKADLELERIEKVNKIKRQILAGFILVVIAVTGVVYAAERYADWRTEHQWQFPAKWIGLVRVIENTVTGDAYAKEPMTDMEVIEQYKLEPVIKSIYMLESTHGQNDGCKDDGKFNGYGFGQNSSSWNCYDSFEEVTERVNYWLEDRLSANGNNLTEAICYYNTGLQWKETCGDYSTNFWSVIVNYF